MRPTGPGGFTLIELTMAVAMLGLLAAIALPKANDAFRRSQEARTKGNLAQLRAAIAMHLTQSEGTFPTNLEELTNSPSPILERLPLKLTPPYHPEGNSVTNGATLDMPDSHGDWFYFNRPDEPEFGTVVVNCVHTDLNGKIWTSF